MATHHCVRMWERCGTFLERRRWIAVLRVTRGFADGSGASSRGTTSEVFRSIAPRTMGRCGRALLSGAASVHSVLRLYALSAGKMAVLGLRAGYASRLCNGLTSLVAPRRIMAGAWPTGTGSSGVPPTQAVVSSKAAAACSLFDVRMCQDVLGVLPVVQMYKYYYSSTY